MFPSHPRAVVTGGGSGLGRAICLELARRKARILVADVHTERAGETVALIAQAGGEAHALHCDVREVGDIEKLAAFMEKTWGGTDILVNNAGVACAGRVGEASLEDWKWIVDINLWGPVHGCHVFLPMMKKQGRGWILNVASAAGIASIPEMASYNVTKAGVVSLSETLFSEVAKDNINISVLCPTFFKTNLLETMRAPEARQINMAKGFFARSKSTAEQVASEGLDALEKGRLYVIPQADGKLMWRLKRLNPQFYFNQIVKQYKGGLFDKIARGA